jgi:magnesium transporter
MASRRTRSIPSVSIRIRCWHDGAIEESTDVDELGRLVAGKGSATWIDLTNPGPELVRAVGRRLGLHHLLADDIVEHNERAKVQLVGDVIHVVAFVLERKATVTTHEVDFVLGRGFLLSVHGQEWDPNAAHQVRMGLEPLLSKGPDLLLWAFVDSIIDGYFPVFDRLGDEIDDVEDAALARAVPATLQHIFRLKRELLRIRHALAPSREVFAQLTSREFDLIAEPHVFYFRDVYDHLIRLNDELDSFRELVAGALEVYLSSINNNLSAIMKRLTGVTVILAGIGAIGGLFGMSEAATAFAGGEGSGFYLIFAGTIILAIASVFVLRRIDWI